MAIVNNMAFWALTFDVIGKVLIAATALLASKALIKEKLIDEVVIKDLRLEIFTGFIGILFIVLGYALNLVILRG